MNSKPPCNYSLLRLLFGERVNLGRRADLQGLFRVWEGGITDTWITRDPLSPMAKLYIYIYIYIYTSGLRPLLAPLANPHVFALALVKV